MQLGAKESSEVHALNATKNDTPRRSSPQVYLDQDIMSGSSRVFVRMSASDAWMPASLQNNASEISTDTLTDSADNDSGRFPNAFTPLHLSAELKAGSLPHLVAPDGSNEHLKALPECTSPETLKLASSIAEIKIADTTLSSIYTQSAAIHASSATCQSSVSCRAEKSPAKHYVQLPILSSYADATNFAARFPDLASEVLSRPLKTAVTSGFANVEVSAKETRQPKMPEHTADRPNWALAPEEMPESNDSARPGNSSIGPDAMDVEATADICLPRSRRTKVSVRASVPGDIGSSSSNLESLEQSRNKPGVSGRRNSLRRGPQTKDTVSRRQAPMIKAANSHIRFGGMRGFGDKQGNSTDHPSHTASLPVDWTSNISPDTLPEASNAPKHLGCEEVWPSCRTWDIIDDRSPRPKFDNEWDNSSVEASLDSTRKIVEFPNSQQTPQIDRWSRPVVQASWDYPSLVRPEVALRPQNSSYRPFEPSQQPPIESVQSSGSKQPQTHPLVGWMPPSDIKGGISSCHHAEHSISLQSCPQSDCANECHTSLPLRRILPGDVGHASTVMDNHLNDISILTSPLTTPSARKSFVRETIIKAEQRSESPVDVVKTRLFTQSVPLTPRMVLFGADSWNSAAPYEVLGTSRGERGAARKEPSVWYTAQTEMPKVTPVTINNKFPVKSEGNSTPLDDVVPLAACPSPTLGDSVYQSRESHVSATTPATRTLRRVPEPEVEPRVDETRRLHILKPKEQTIQSRPVASRSDLTPSKEKKQQCSLDSNDQSQIPPNASHGPEKLFAICESPAYPSAAETSGEGKGEVHARVSSQVKGFSEDPKVRCISDATTPTPERRSETEQDGCKRPKQHPDGYAWRSGRSVSDWRCGLLDQSSSQKYVAPPARRFSPSTLGEGPSLKISEQSKIYTFKLPPIAPVPGSTSQDVNAAPEAQVKQSVSEVEWEVTQNTDATDVRNNNTFAADVSAPEITKLTAVGQSSPDVHASLFFHGSSPLCNIDNANTDLSEGNCFEPSKSPPLSLSDSNCVLEQKTPSGAPSNDKVETPDLLPASQNSSSVLMASRLMDQENMLDCIPPPPPTLWLSNRVLSSPHLSPEVVAKPRWSPPSARIASSIHEHILTRQDSIDVTDHSHHLSQPPSSSSNPDIFSAQNQSPIAFVHDSACTPIQGYLHEIPSVHSKLHRHPPYCHPGLTQDLVGSSRWIACPNLDGDAQYLINQRRVFDITTPSPQSHREAGHLPQGESPLVNSSLSQRSGFMSGISSRPIAPSGLAFRTQYPAGSNASFLSG
ncbi:uncharacterized protein BT62DRAFT_930474 [Guyanagaster necrorhizus]|uniref:Uncharacterized protein n=1 Tax=Guyanagaster necrorhizus TaxID=856835 RepID=A0A9P7VU68_9AGAR|nr:uncharacterized protein BT62DRAFT_930474 [Guyanagaster necrorhizus MCA 3950]KAG7447463.1 hypothetical protein BT62DRAFT_930474 [Guyanagaster necrorhizus MCA 3950]